MTLLNSLLSPPSTNAVTGALSSTDNALARWDGASGAVIQNSGAILDDSNNLSAVNSIALVVGIVGVTSGAAASAGYVGEVIQANTAVGSPISLTTATVAVITSIALSAGQWRISANPTLLGTAVTATELQTFLATASGTSTTGQNTYNTSYATPPTVGATTTSTASITYDLNISSPTTIYLKALATFSLGTVVAYGGISALRVR